MFPSTSALKLLIVRPSAGARRFSSLVGVDGVMGDSCSHPFVTEQVIEFPVLIVGVLCRPLTQFLLHFAHIHR